MSEFINGYFRIDDKDIDRAIKSTGAKNHYVFGGFYHIYTSNPLTEQEQEKYENDAQEILGHHAARIAKDIDAEIIKQLRENGY